jgi:hypothetical protein
MESTHRFPHSLEIASRFPHSTQADDGDTLSKRKNNCRQTEKILDAEQPVTCGCCNRVALPQSQPWCCAIRTSLRRISSYSLAVVSTPRVADLQAAMPSRIERLSIFGASG